MLARRSHKKSRHGCLGCKSRKVKCDEKSPTCSACAHRQTKCVYKPLEGRIRQSRSVPSASTDGTRRANVNERAFVIDSSSSLPELARILSNQLKFPTINLDVSHAVLLSEYLHHTCISCAGVDRMTPRFKVFEQVIPTLAIGHTGVSQAIFAIATLSVGLRSFPSHSQSESFSGSTGMRAPGSAFYAYIQPYLHQAQRHYGKCISSLRMNLAQFNDANADAAIACSVLLMYYEFINSKISRRCAQLDVASMSSSNRRVNSDAGLNLNWMVVVRGVGSVANLLYTQKLWRTSTMQPYFVWEDGRDHISAKDMETSGRMCQMNGISQAHGISHPLCRTIIAEGQQAITTLYILLQSLKTTADDSPKHRVRNSQEVMSQCLEAVRRLDLVIQRFKTSVVARKENEFIRILMLWVAHVEEPFFVLLAEEHPHALAVYAHFLVFTILFEGTWYVGDLGRETIKRILTIVRRHYIHSSGSFADESDSNLEEIFRWPAHIIHC